MNATTFHASNFGKFGSMLPTDSEGYTHTTIRGWMGAGKSRSEARELAVAAKEAVAEAEQRLAEWQEKN